jgi:hypothetical protein
MSPVEHPPSQLDLPAEVSAYAQWPRLLKEPHRVAEEFAGLCVVGPDTEPIRKYGPHAFRSILVYGNRAAAEALSDPTRKALPEGSIIVKEKLGPTAGAPDGIGVMVKRGTSRFPETRGWEFLFFPAKGSRPAQERCASCHVAAASTDYVFGRYPR